MAKLLKQMFQHTAARRRLGFSCPKNRGSSSVSTHSRPKAAGSHRSRKMNIQEVSTHSRPKAAGTAEQSIRDFEWFQHTAARRRLGKEQRAAGNPRRFNTQPPEGGWPAKSSSDGMTHLFQHTAARRRLEGRISQLERLDLVSTHSRPKAAGSVSVIACGSFADVSTHSRPKAAGYRCRCVSHGFGGFNTQPPEGGWIKLVFQFPTVTMFQHTAARRRLENFEAWARKRGMFQHTAARRRLDAASLVCHRPNSCFNTQPPEGGW